MVKDFNIKIYLIIFSCMIMSSCSVNESIQKDFNLEKDFSEAKILFDEGKFSKALEKFKYIIYNNPGSLVAMNSQLYLAESLFNLEKYDQASKEYDRYILVSQDSQGVEKAKFFICKCFFKLSSSYKKDQEASYIAIDRMQYFIEQYPNSQFSSECNVMITELRSKLAKKDLESGKLYLRIEEFPSAIVYFNSVIRDYYDTEYYETAIINLILTYVLNGEIALADNTFNQYKDDLQNKDNYIAAKNILTKDKDTLSLKEYFNLVK